MSIVNCKNIYRENLKQLSFNKLASIRELQLNFFFLKNGNFLVLVVNPDVTNFHLRN